jgi:ketosteroid isomerase-like protein
MSSSDAELRKRHIEIFTTMLGHLGEQQYEACGRYLAPDIHADWPYVPAPGCPENIVGRDALLAFFAGGMAGFEPYRYRIAAIHELADANRLIAEYSSHSRFLANGRPYSNRYCSVLHFNDGLITYWREYVNPETIRLAMA